MTFNDLFEQEIRKLCADEAARLTEHLVLGLAVPDYAEYRYIVGKIAGLRLIADLCEDATRNLSER